MCLDAGMALAPTQTKLKKCVRREQQREHKMNTKDTGVKKSESH